MGDMTLLITGAAGYIGRAAVSEARMRGHRVVAVMRHANQAPDRWDDDDGITTLACDLTNPTDALVAHLRNVDCTIHCAASLSGDANRHAVDTDIATRTLLKALPQGAKLVHVSSIAVHDFETPNIGDILNEQAPLETQPQNRDAYATAKLAQEHLVRSEADAKSLALTILRPGVVFGPERLWNAHLGITLGPVLLRLGHRGQIPLAHVDLTARALISAAEHPATDPIFVVDDDLPDRIRYLASLKKGPKLILPLPQFVIAPLQTAATRAARYKPLGFDNSRLRNVLKVHQTKGFDLLMHEAQL